MGDSDGHIFLLYVDDEAVLLDVTKQYLENTGDYSIDTASSAKQALQMIQEDTYDAIVSDYQMPEMDGIEFLKTLRAEGNMIPFVIFTGKGREEVAIEALNAGADYYLQKGGKPKVQFGELQNFVRQAVEKNRAEKELLEHEQKMTDVINFMPDAILALNLDGEVIAWNRAIEQMTATSASDMLGKGNYECGIPFYGMRHPVLGDVVLNKDLQKDVSYPILNGDDSDKLFAETFIPSLHNGDGAYLWITASPLYDTDGNVTGVIESIRDINERKRAEEAIRESETKFREIFNTTGDIIFLNEFPPGGPPGRFLEVNDSTCRTLGYTRDELLQMSLRDIEGPEARDNFQGIVDQFCTKGRATFEAKAIRKDGTIAYIENNACCFTLHNQLVHLSVGRDITERKKAENALKTLNKKLNLLSSITRHDISNQICALMGYEYLLENEIDEEKNRVYLKPIIEATGRIQDQIAFTRDYQELGVHSPSWQSVESVVNSVLSDMSAPGFEVRTDVGSVEIFADHMLEKVFYNLFGNAIRYGEHVTEICVSFQEMQGDGILAIEDNGVGVADDMKKMIFDRGVGLNTGFGLFLTREILEITELSILETGTKGSGARFEIRVPKGSYRFTD